MTRANICLSLLLAFSLLYSCEKMSQDVYFNEDGSGSTEMVIKIGNLAMLASMYKEGNEDSDGQMFKQQINTYFSSTTMHPTVLSTASTMPNC